MEVQGAKMSPKSIPNHYYPQFCQHCADLHIRITGDSESEVKVRNVKMQGRTVFASPDIDAVFLCPSCDGQLSIYEIEET